jgi:hypothetical protein
LIEIAQNFALQENGDTCKVFAGMVGVRAVKLQVVDLDSIVFFRNFVIKNIQ